jgi:RNase P/RNase MRP subunit POP5
MEKKLIPSHRENKRYILIDKSIQEAEKAILDFIGILGYAKAGVSFPQKNILAVNREQVDQVRSALVLAGIKVKRVSGSIKNVKPI